MTNYDMAQDKFIYAFVSTKITENFPKMSIHSSSVNKERDISYI